jgi:hypothetical protein
MKRLPYFAALAFLLLLCQAKGAGVECDPGSIAFTLTDSGSEFIWQGVRLSVRRLTNARLREHVCGYGAPAGPGLAKTISLSMQAPQTALFENGSASLTREAVRLASNVRRFRRTILIESGGFDLADNSHCRSHQINLHCSDLSYPASGRAVWMSCRLTVLDPAEVITP